MVQLTQEQKKLFTENFLQHYLAGGLGTMTKTEIDILVYHLIADSKDIKGKSNYEVANQLRITERKVKSLRLNAALRYQQANHKAVLGDIVLRIIEVINRPDFDDGVVTLSIENPVEQRELEHALKTAGHHIEYGLNRELFKIKPIALFELLVANLENPKEQFATMVQASIKNRRAQAAILDDALTLRQKFNKLAQEVSDKASLIKLLGMVKDAIC